MLDNFLSFLCSKILQGCPEHEAYIHDEHQADEEQGEILDRFSWIGRVADVVQLGKEDWGAEEESFCAKLDNLLRGRYELMLVSQQVDYRCKRKESVHDHLHRRVVEKEDCCADEERPSVKEDQDVDELLVSLFGSILAWVESSVNFFWFIFLQDAMVLAKHEEKEHRQSVGD